MILCDNNICKIVNPLEGSSIGNHHENEVLRTMRFQVQILGVYPWPHVGGGIVYLGVIMVAVGIDHVSSYVTRFGFEFEFNND